MGAITSMNNIPDVTSRPKRTYPQFVTGSNFEPNVVNIPMLYLRLWPILLNTGENAVL